MMDSNVLRLIRRYDPISPNTNVNKARRSLESTRGVWHTVASKTTVSQPSESSPFLSSRSLTTAYEDETHIQKPTTPRLQRQQAIQESEPLSSTSTTNKLRPILKYNSKSRSEFIVQPHQTEPLKIEIESQIPTTNEITSAYQPLITIGTKRVCSALSKSEWDLRLQQEQLPIQSHSPSPSPLANNQQQEQESYRPSLGRSKSSMVINNNSDNEDDDFDEKSAPIIGSGSCVEKLKKLFVTKSSLDLTNTALNSQHRHDSIDSNLNRRLSATSKFSKSPSPAKHPSIINSAELQTPIICKPATIIEEVLPVTSAFICQPAVITEEVLPMATNFINKSAINMQEVTPTTPTVTNKQPIVRSQKAIDSLESVSGLNHNSTMPSSELTYDGYHFRRLNNLESTATRPRNIAKVEPYSINTNAVRPLYQSSSMSQPVPVTNTKTSTTTTARTTAAAITTSKARINLDSMGNTPTTSSTSSSAGSLGSMTRHPNAQTSDFLEPNPAYSIPHAQPFSNSSSYTTPPLLLSESLTHGSLHSSPTANILSYSGHTPPGLNSSTNSFQPKYPSSMKGDFNTGMHTLTPSISHNNYSSPTSYHSRPTIAMTSSNYQKQPEIPKRSAVLEQQQQQPQHNNFHPRQEQQQLKYNHQYHHQQQQQQQPQPQQQQQQHQQHHQYNQHQQDEPISSGQNQLSSRRRFQRRKEMKRSKSVDIYQEPSSYNTSIMKNELDKSYRQQKSTSREDLGGRENLSSLSSSSSSSSSIADIERVNRAALLRYKSLDSITFNNRKSNFNTKNTNISHNNNNRRIVSRQADLDFDSDDSVCGIPKPRN